MGLRRTRPFEVFSEPKPKRARLSRYQRRNPQTLAELLAEHVAPNPVVFITLAAVSKSFYKTFMSDKVWRPLDVNQVKRNIASDFIKSLETFKEEPCEHIQTKTLGKLPHAVHGLVGLKDAQGGYECRKCPLHLAQCRLMASFWNPEVPAIDSEGFDASTVPNQYLQLGYCINGTKLDGAVTTRKYHKECLQEQSEAFLCTYVDLGGDCAVLHWSKKSNEAIFLAAVSHDARNFAHFNQSLRSNRTLLKLLLKGPALEYTYCESDVEFIQLALDLNPRALVYALQYETPQYKAVKRLVRERSSARKYDFAIGCVNGRLQVSWDFGYGCSEDKALKYIRVSPKFLNMFEELWSCPHLCKEALKKNDLQFVPPPGPLPFMRSCENAQIRHMAIEYHPHNIRYLHIDDLNVRYFARAVDAGYPNIKLGLKPSIIDKYLRDLTVIRRLLLSSAHSHLVRDESACRSTTKRLALKNWIPAMEVRPTAFTLVPRTKGTQPEPDDTPTKVEHKVKVEGGTTRALGKWETALYHAALTQGIFDVAPSGLVAKPPRLEAKDLKALEILSTVGAVRIGLKDQHGMKLINYKSSSGEGVAYVDNEPLVTLCRAFGFKSVPHHLQTKVMVWDFLERRGPIQAGLDFEGVNPKLLFDVVSENLWLFSFCSAKDQEQLTQSFKNSEGFAHHKYLPGFPPLKSGSYRKELAKYYEPLIHNVTLLEGIKEDARFYCRVVASDGRRFHHIPSKYQQILQVQKSIGGVRKFRRPKGL